MTETEYEQRQAELEDRLERDEQGRPMRTFEVQDHEDNTGWCPGCQMRVFLDLKQDRYGNMKLKCCACHTEIARLEIGLVYNSYESEHREEFLYQAHAQRRWDGEREHERRVADQLLAKQRCKEDEDERFPMGISTWELGWSGEKIHLVEAGESQTMCKREFTWYYDTENGRRFDRDGQEVRMGRGDSHGRQRDSTIHTAGSRWRDVCHNCQNAFERLGVGSLMDVQRHWRETEKKRYEAMQKYTHELDPEHGNRTLCGEALSFVTQHRRWSADDTIELPVAADGEVVTCKKCSERMPEVLDE